MAGFPVVFVQLFVNNSLIKSSQYLHFTAQMDLPWIRLRRNDCTYLPTVSIESFVLNLGKSPIIAVSRESRWSMLSCPGLPYSLSRPRRFWHSSTSGGTMGLTSKGFSGSHSFT